MNKFINQLSTSVRRTIDSDFNELYRSAENSEASRLVFDIKAKGSDVKDLIEISYGGDQDVDEEMKKVVEILKNLPEGSDITITWQTKDHRNLYDVTWLSGR